MFNSVPLRRVEDVVVEVVDSIMGSGKSSAIFNMINKNPNDRYMYVSPMLSEVGKNGRIHEAVIGCEFISPDTSDQHTTKIAHLKDLLLDGANIACTHNLYLSMTNEHFQIMETKGYTVILDEEIEVIKTYGAYSSSDIHYLIAHGDIVVNDKDGAIEWIGSGDHVEEYEHKYYRLKNLCDKKSIYLNRGVSAKSNILISHIPLRLLQCAKRVIVMTYMFDGSILDCFLKLKGIKTVPCLDIKPEFCAKPSDFKDLITLVAPNKKTNKLTMSKYWWEKLSPSNEEDVKAVNSISNLIMNTAKQFGISNSEVIWTCPKENAYGVSDKPKKLKLKPLGYIKYTEDEVVKSCWLSVHTRATNDYSDKKMVAHCYNRYPILPIATYLKTCGFPVDQERYAISSMLQFVWRSRIRKGEPIVLLIANTRMYKLMLQWLDGYFD